MRHASQIILNIKIVSLSKRDFLLTCHLIYRMDSSSVMYIKFSFYILLLLALSCQASHQSAANPKVGAAEMSAIRAQYEHQRYDDELLESQAQFTQPTIYFYNGTILTAAGENFSPGFLLISQGIIQNISKQPFTPPKEAISIDMKGGYLTPGLIDPHSHIGVYSLPSTPAHSDGNEMVRNVTPSVRAVDAFWPQDPSIYKAVQSGVTTIQVLPGSANLIGGLATTIHLLPQRSAQAMVIAEAPQALKMACGENPKRVYGEKGGPQTRMGSINVLRDVFIAAQKYKKNWDDYYQKVADEKDLEKRKKMDPPERDLDKEILTGVLEGKIYPNIHCYRADDMINMIELADEFKFSIRAFHHSIEAYKIRDILSQKGIGAITWSDWWGFKAEAYDGIMENLSLLDEAGVTTVLHSDSPYAIQYLNQDAAKAYYKGKAAGIKVSETDALQWITLNPAKIMGIDGLTGSLEKGKWADVVLWDKHPFSVYAKVQKVVISGTVAYDRSRENLSPWSDFLLGQE